MAKTLLIPFGGGGGGGDMSNYYTKQQIDAMLQGVQSIQGFQGTTGAQGTTGFQGLIGIQGANGLQGEKGADGIQGATGIQGEKGSDGAQGATGLQGEKGESIQGADGAQGTMGLQGYTGIQGPAGGGGGVETVELTELTESELGELYEIVVNSDPVGIDDYLAEHRLVAYGMPVLCWGNTAYTINESNELVEDGEGDNGAAFYSDPKIEKVVGTDDTITTYWYCIFKQEEGGNYTYVLEEGNNIYENSGGGTPIQGIQGVQGTAGTNGVQGIQGTAGTNGVDGLQGIQGIQGASGGSASKIELTTLPVQDLLQFYQATLAGTMKDFSQYTAGGYPLINAYQMNAGWVVDTSYLTDVEGTTYTTDGTEVAIVMNQMAKAVGTRRNETQRYFSTFITLFSPTIYQTYGQTIDITINVGYNNVAQLQFVLADDSIVNYTMPLTQW